MKLKLNILLPNSINDITAYFLILEIEENIVKNSQIVVLALNYGLL